jgi:hypothetical protein
MSWLYPSLAGSLAAPCGGILGVLVAYVVLSLVGVSEREGRRGLTALLYGALPGAIAGFLLAFRAASWIARGGGGEWRRELAGALIAIPLAVAAGVGGLIAGIHWAEAHGVPHGGGQRGAWGLRRVALPAATAAGALGYLLGVWLANA